MIDISYLEIEEPDYARNFEEFCAFVYPLCGGDSQRELSITLTDDETMKELNLHYRGKNESTDVLSFAFDDEDSWPVGPEQPLGQIIISLNTLQINAEYFKIEREEELKRLVIHGILHLLGFNHQSNEESEPMLQKQEALLKQCNGFKIGVNKTSLD